MLSLSAESDLVIKEDKSYSLNHHLWYFMENNSNIPKDQINSSLYESKFIYNESGKKGFGFKDDSLWIRLKIKNDLENKQDFYISSENPFTDSLLYLEFDDKNPSKISKELEVGDRISIESREVLHRYFVFKVTIPSQKSKTVYLKYRTNGVLQVNLFISSIDVFQENSYLDNFCMGIILGTMIIMFFYNLFIYFSTQEKSFIYYCVLIFFMILTQVSIQGYGQIYLWSKWLLWSDYSTNILSYLSVISLVIFSYDFLQLHTLRKMNILKNSVLTILVILGFIGLYLGNKFLSLFLLSFTAILSLLIIILSIIQYRNGVNTAKFYLLAWFCLYASSILIFFNRLGIINSFFISEYSLSISSSIGLAVLSLGLADKINSMKKERESFLKDYNKNLENEILERTKQIENAKQVAEKANEAKTLFLAKMNHELRTPLNGILGMLQNISISELDAKNKEMLDIINTSSNNLLVIINDILDYTNIESGKLELFDSKFQFKEFIASLVKIQKSNLENKNLILNLNIEDSIPELIECDKERLAQLLFNLITNAIKYTDKGEINLDIKQSIIDDHFTKLIFKIKDTGIGISSEKLSTLFQTFHQLDNSLTRKYGGIGLGLVISKKIIEAMNGSIFVESIEGVGSTFSFSIQVKQVQDSNKNSENLKITSDIQSNLIESILIVEDDKINQSVIQKMLKNLKFKYETVNNGMESIENFRKLNSPLILMDIEMPVMNGIDATVEIRRITANNIYPIIIGVSAHTVDEIKKQALQAGMNDFISKPVSIQVLREKINYWLKKASSI
jgi:hypothetical protein